MKCMIDGCENDAVGRGLCPACYQAALRRVKNLEVTWEQLVNAGLALEAKHAGRRAKSPFAVALEKKLPPEARAESSAPKSVSEAPGCLTDPKSRGDGPHRNPPARKLQRDIVIAGWDRGVDLEPEAKPDIPQVTNYELPPEPEPQPPAVTGRTLCPSDPPEPCYPSPPPNEPPRRWAPPKPGEE